METTENDNLTMKDKRNYSLMAHNTFGIEAKCSRFLEYDNVEEAQHVARVLHRSRMPMMVIGSGSNLLLTRDFNGIVVHSAMKDYSQQGCRFTCGSGMLWDDVVDISIKAGCYGAENLSLIPGDVGASAVQNIGAYGSEVKDLIVEIEAVEIASARVCTINPVDCQYAYRQSRFKGEWKNKYLITRVTYEFSKEFVPRLEYGNILAELNRRGIEHPTPQQLRETIIDIRNAKLPDPKVLGNGGSFFMNPVVSKAKYMLLSAQYPGMPHYDVDSRHVKIPAGWMIEQCGWKGRSLGRAGVHDKQALVLVNRGSATGTEIVELCRAIQHDVKERFGVCIYPEVNIV